MTIPLKLAEEMASASRLEKLRRLNYMIDQKKAEISSRELEMEALQCLHTELTYFEES